MLLQRCGPGPLKLIAPCHWKWMVGNTIVSFFAAFRRIFRGKLAVRFRVPGVSPYSCTVVVQHVETNISYWYHIRYPTKQLYINNQYEAIQQPLGCTPCKCKRPRCNLVVTWKISGNPQATSGKKTIENRVSSQKNGKIPMFSLILPTWTPGKIPPSFSPNFPTIRKTFLRKLLGETSFWYLPGGPVGETLDMWIFGGCIYDCKWMGFMGLVYLAYIDPIKNQPFIFFVIMPGAHNSYGDHKLNPIKFTCDLMAIHL